MITNFDNFENIRRFWLIKISDEIFFLASLYHINCTKNDIKYFTEIANNLNEFNAKYIYINKDTIDDSGKKTGLRGYDDYSKESFEWYKDNNFIYKGEINPTEQEIKMAELELATNKYNL